MVRGELLGDGGAVGWETWGREGKNDEDVGEGTRSQTP